MSGTAPLYPDVIVEEPADPAADLALHSLVFRVSAALTRAGVNAGEVRLFEDSAGSFTSYASVLRVARSWVTVTPAAEADYIRTYEETWKERIENPDGSLRKDQVMRELHDYLGLMRRAAEVYESVTGGRISKPESAAEAVIRVAGEYTGELIERALAEAGEDSEDGSLPKCCADYSLGHDPRLAGEGCRDEPYYGVAGEGSAAYDALYSLYMHTPHTPGDWPRWLASPEAKPR
jgi:hypothetical protein